MPFIAFGLDEMEKGGLGAIIIQDSAGSGKAITTNKLMLKKHSLKASIKMPTDLFQPMAGVQTSIYIFEAHKQHDFDMPVKFIDFRDDGYKRTKRGMQEINEPSKRYSDIIKIYKSGKKAKVESNLNLDAIYIEDFITSNGADWNFDQHKIIDTKPTLADFKKTVSDYLAWEVSNILKQHGSDDSLGK
jgi:type I restriction-modification system DNA methylase subunit